MSIEIQDVVKHFPGSTVGALNGVTFTVNEGEMIGFLGPSGSGKTTLLRLIAGLDTQTSGHISIRGQRVDRIPPQKRQVGVVFQNYALFKHMTVFDNIAFGLRVQRRKSSEIKKRVMDLLDLVRLTGFEHRYPHQLSGGQAQRVALARALAPEPSVLLLDEPFAAIDTKVRRELRTWVRQIHDEIGITSIFVTHDQEEALEIADRVLVLNQGRVEQFDTPAQVYDSPSSLFVADFVGESNILEGVVVDGIAEIDALQFQVKEYTDGQRVKIVFRPNEIRFGDDLFGPGRVGIITRMTYKGNYYAVEVRLPSGRHLQAYLDRNLGQQYEIGQSVSLNIVDFKVFQA
ncbi:ABC transporter ATP-binding protein [Alicyclobacillus acidiphilus]|uniref:ABC transporter ATP-binding protein n=1 Tax=Alicyclobacillus acidiphilus TaxID=182455 RepID=UPI0009FB1784|nr:ABC transporter ATP-binding protein [Alicyclobacillus acidiphilus]